MYPTYSGMNAVMYEDKDDAPAALTKTFRFLTLGARHKALIAQNSGDIQIPMAATQDGGMRIYFKQVKGNLWSLSSPEISEIVPREDCDVQN